MGSNRRSLVLRALSGFVMLPVAVLVIVFSLSNRAPVALDLWPLPYSVEVPVFAAVLGAAAAGFLAGGLVAWLSGARARRRARAAEAEAARSGREARQLRDKVTKLEAVAARHETAATVPAISPPPPGAAA